MAFIIRRRLTPYARVKTPVELVGVLGTHVVKTLRTTDRRIGQPRGALFRARISNIFDIMKHETRANVLGIPIDEVRKEDLVRCDRVRLSDRSTTRISEAEMRASVREFEREIG